MKAIKIPQPFQLNIENIPTPTIKTPNDVLKKSLPAASAALTWESGMEQIHSPPTHA